MATKLNNPKGLELAEVEPVKSFNVQEIVRLYLEKTQIKARRRVHSPNEWLYTLLDVIFETSFQEIDNLEKRRIAEEIAESGDDFSDLDLVLKEEAQNRLLPIVLNFLREKIESKLQVKQLTEEFARQVKEVQARAETAEARAETDRLTGLKNKLGFEEALAERLRGGKKAFLFIDTNAFKQINDRLSHSVGNEALKKIASNFLLGILRDTDLVARVGGDEFIILLEVDSDQDVETAMQRIINAFMENPLVIPYSDQDLSTFNPNSYKIIEKTDGTKDLYLTLAISIGGEWITSADEYEDVNNIADGKMYEAKRLAKLTGGLPLGSAYCFNGSEAKLMKYPS